MPKPNYLHEKVSGKVTDRGASLLRIIARLLPFGAPVTSEPNLDEKKILGLKQMFCLT